MKIVVVEDDDKLREVLMTGLAHLTYEVRGAADGRTMDSLLAEEPADVVILDLTLPGEDGLEIAARLRKVSDCGIIIATSRGTVDERVLGYEHGADLYFTKPYRINELAAAINNLRHRIPANIDSCWVLNESMPTLTTPQGVEIVLTKAEYQLLSQLMRKPGENVPKRKIHAELGRYDDFYADMRLEALVNQLRARVLEAAPETPLPVRTHHEHGYAFIGCVNRKHPHR